MGNGRRSGFGNAVSKIEDQIVLAALFLVSLDQPAHRLLEFREVVRPVVSDQRSNDRRREFTWLFPEISHEPLHQKRDILDAIAQRRNLNCLRLAAVIQFAWQHAAADSALVEDQNEPGIALPDSCLLSNLVFAFRKGMHDPAAIVQGQALEPTYRNDIRLASKLQHANLPAKSGIPSGTEELFGATVRGGEFQFPVTALFLVEHLSCGHVSDRASSRVRFAVQKQVLPVPDSALNTVQHLIHGVGTADYPVAPAVSVQATLQPLDAVLQHFDFAKRGNTVQQRLFQGGPVHRGTADEPVYARLATESLEIGPPGYRTAAQIHRQRLVRTANAVDNVLRRQRQVIKSLFLDHLVVIVRIQAEVDAERRQPRFDHLAGLVTTANIADRVKPL